MKLKNVDAIIVDLFLMKGTKISTSHMSYIKVMAVEDGYVMARRKGCVPFCRSIKSFLQMVRVDISNDHKYKNELIAYLETLN